MTEDEERSAVKKNTRAPANEWERMLSGEL